MKLDIILLINVLMISSEEVPEASDFDFKEHSFKPIKALQCNNGAQRYFQTNGKCGRKVTNKYLKVPVEENAYV